MVDGVKRLREWALDAAIWVGLGGCAILTGLAFLASFGGLLWLAAGVIP